MYVCTYIYDGVCVYVYVYIYGDIYDGVLVCFQLSRSLVLSIFNFLNPVLF